MKVYIANDLLPVDSSWTSWENSGACTQPCDGGKQRQIRQCLLEIKSLNLFLILGPIKTGIAKHHTTEEILLVKGFLKNMWTAIVSLVLVSCFFIFYALKKLTMKKIALIKVLTPHLPRKMSDFAHCVLFY